MPVIMSSSGGAHWWKERDSGGYTVSLSLRDELDELMNLRLLVTRQEMALELKKRFLSSAETLYPQLLAVLYGTASGEKNVEK